MNKPDDKGSEISRVLKLRTRAILDLAITLLLHSVNSQTERHRPDIIAQLSTVAERSIQWIYSLTLVGDTTFVKSGRL